MKTADRDAGTIAYVGSPLPQRSQTFVYREMLGLRSRGWSVLPVTVGPPETGDPEIDAVAAEAVQVYSAEVAMRLASAGLLLPGQVARALKDSLAADLDGPLARVKFFYQACMGLATARRLRRRGIVHVHAHLANVPATVGLYLARGLGAGFSFTGHAADLFVHRNALAFKLREARFASCISHWHRGFYNGIVPDADDRRPIIRCSVAMPPAAALDLPGRDIVVVARLVEKKGIDMLVRALAQVPGDIRLKIAGDGPERPRLEALAAELGVAGRIDFLGSTPHAECLRLIAGCALFVLPCRTSGSGDRDGIPVVLMEAMAAGRAVVAGRLESIAELVEDGAGGLLVPPDDVPALAEAIRTLAKDPARRAAFGRAARKRVEDEFSDDVNWNRLEAALHEAIEGRRAGHG